VNAIIFLAPISTYDEYLSEDPTTNRLIDSLHLWRTICNSPLLARVGLILFFNKRDVLEAKVRGGGRVEKYFRSFGEWVEREERGEGGGGGGGGSGTMGRRGSEPKGDKTGDEGGALKNKDRSEVAKLFVSCTCLPVSRGLRKGIDEMADMKMIFRTELVSSSSCLISRNES
jgi:hypothetical protein